MRKLYFLFALVLFQVQLYAQIQGAKLDSLFDNLKKRDLAFGNVIIVKKEDDPGTNRIVYSRSIGYARIDGTKRIPSAIETKYKIGSVSKMFTAVLIFQLIEEGKLTLDQTLSTYYPDIPNAGKITIAHLLSHRSGLHDYTKDTDFEKWMSKPKSHEQLLQIIRDKGSDFEPGTRAEYCNSNYLLLSYILEKITGKDYTKVLTERITSRIAMWDFPTKKTSKALSYKYTNGSWKPVQETYPGIHSGAGEIVATASGVAGLTHILFDDGFIKKSSLDKMMTMTDGYGMGLFPYDHGASKGYGHNGRIEEFYTATRYFPDQKLTIVYCTNGINFPRVDILESIVNACFNEPFTIPFTTTSPVNPDRFTGTYEAPQMPVVTISVQNSKVVAETQGVTFELEPVADNYLMHAPTGYYFEFNPAERSLQIKETDNVYFLKKK